MISLLPFSDTTLLPDLTNVRCVPNLTTNTHELDLPVKAGRAYTVQIGGVDSAQGMLEFLFDFFPDITRISADTTLVAQQLPNGIRVKSFRVTAPRGTRVELRCTRGCPTRAKTAGAVTFPGFAGTRLTAGSKLEVFVTAKNAIGAYIEYRIGRGSFTKITRCLSPGSRTPKVKC
ncbi:MAG: hypothetical protein ACR2KV_06445 [Solirubrobacteraceae bacterium]